MVFDINLAIAKLDFNGFGYSDRPDLDSLRATYPELGFVFDLLEDKTMEAKYGDDEHRRDCENYQEKIDDLELRVQDMRLAFYQIKELTIDAEITTIIEDIL